MALVSNLKNKKKLTAAEANRLAKLKMRGYEVKEQGRKAFYNLSEDEKYRYMK